MENPTAQQEIRIGIANACVMMPKTPKERREAVELVFHREAELKRALKEVKEDSLLPDAVETVTKSHGVSKRVLDFLKHLDCKKPGDRAFELTQLAVLSQSLGYMDKDLVMLAEEATPTIGADLDEQGSVFDNTPSAQRQGLDRAEPTPVKAKAAAPAGTPTPGIPLDEAERLFKAAQEKFAGKRGRKPAEYLAAEATFKAALDADSGLTEKPAPVRSRPVLVDDDFEDGAPMRSDNPLEGATGSGTFTHIA